MTGTPTTTTFTRPSKAKDVRAQFYKKYKVKIVKRRWGNNFHNELTYITIEDWT